MGIVLALFICINMYMHVHAALNQTIHYYRIILQHKSSMGYDITTALYFNFYIPLRKLHNYIQLLYTA